MPAARAPARLRRASVFLLASAIIAFLGLEVVLRLLTTTREGAPYLLGSRLLPIERVTDRHDAILKSPADSFPYVAPDPELGWTIRPGGRHPSLPYAANALGLRSAPRELPEARHAGTARMLVVGDSFAHGSELPWEETWTALLERRLAGAVEVWNGGVPGYGTDQALLRFRRLSPQVKPEVAVMTVILENLWRNLGLIRALYHPQVSYPWSKPRFVLEGDALTLVNSPVIPPAEVPAELLDLEHSPWRRFEMLWFPEQYEDHWYYRSRLVRLLATRRLAAARHDSLQRLIRRGGRAVDLGAAIAAAFCREARALGARPLVLILPSHREVGQYVERGASDLDAFRAELASDGVPSLDLVPAMARELGPDERAGALFCHGNGHPNARASAVIAQALAVWLEDAPAGG